RIHGGTHHSRGCGVYVTQRREQLHRLPHWELLIDEPITAAEATLLMGLPPRGVPAPTDRAVPLSHSPTVARAIRSLPPTERKKHDTRILHDQSSGSVRPSRG